MIQVEHFKTDENPIKSEGTTLLFTNLLKTMVIEIILF